MSEYTTLEDVLDDPRRAQAEYREREARLLRDGATAISLALRCAEEDATFPRPIIAGIRAQLGQACLRLGTTDLDPVWVAMGERPSLHVYEDEALGERTAVLQLGWGMPGAWRSLSDHADLRDSYRLLLDRQGAALRVQVEF